MVDKVLFWGQNFEMEILMDLHVMRTPDPKITFLVFGLSVCVCYQHNSKTNYNRNIKFGILHLYHIQMLLETFYEDLIKTLCTGTHKRIQIHYGLWTEFLVIEYLRI